MSAAESSKVSVSARRNIKGARRRELARHVAGETVGLTWLPNGSVDVYFPSADGMTHVWLAADVVARLAAGKPAAPAPQVVPPLSDTDASADPHRPQSDGRGLS